MPVDADRSAHEGSVEHAAPSNAMAPAIDGRRDAR